MANNFVETLIGALVLAVAGVFLFFAFTRTDVGQVAGYELSASFDSVDGIVIGSDVRLSGIKVGTVTGQELDPATFRAQVLMAISPEVELPEDSSAKITSEGLLGGNYISLLPGGSPDVLVDGDEIEFTQGSIDLLGLIGQAIFSATGAEAGAE